MAHVGTGGGGSEMFQPTLTEATNGEFADIIEFNYGYIDGDFMALQGDEIGSFHEAENGTRVTAQVLGTRVTAAALAQGARISAS